MASEDNLQKLAHNIRQLREQGKDLETILKENPDLKPGLDLYLNQNPPQGSGACPQTQLPNRAGL